MNDGVGARGSFEGDKEVGLPRGSASARHSSHSGTLICPSIASKHVSASQCLLPEVVR